MATPRVFINVRAGWLASLLGLKSSGAYTTTIAEIREPYLSSGVGWNPLAGHNDSAIWKGSSGSCFVLSGPDGWNAPRVQCLSPIRLLLWNGQTETGWHADDGRGDGNTVLCSHWWWERPTSTSRVFRDWEPEISLLSVLFWWTTARLNHLKVQLELDYLRR